MALAGTAAVAARTIKVDMTSDVICPFCIIGYRQFTSAVEKYNSSHPSSPISAEITMLPYRLMPDLPEESVSKTEIMIKRFGAQRVEQMGPVMRGKLAQVGVNVDYGNREPTLSSTHRAHRLLQYASTHSPSVQASLGEDIMLSHHAEGYDPSNPDKLVQAAIKHGVFANEQEAERFVNGSECSKEVNEGYALARAKGIQGVPFWEFEGKWGVSGAVGEEAFLEILDQVVPKKETTSGAAGESCA